MIDTDHMTRDYLDAKLAELKGDLQKFIMVSFVLFGIAQILVVKFWH